MSSWFPSITALIPNSLSASQEVKEPADLSAPISDKDVGAVVNEFSEVKKLEEENIQILFDSVSKACEVPVLSEIKLFKTSSGWGFDKYAAYTEVVQAYIDAHQNKAISLAGVHLKNSNTPKPDTYTYADIHRLPDYCMHLLGIERHWKMSEGERYYWATKNEFINGSSTFKQWLELVPYLFWGYKADGSRSEFPETTVASKLIKAKLETEDLSKEEKFNYAYLILETASRIDTDAEKEKALMQKVASEVRASLAKDGSLNDFFELLAAKAVKDKNTCNVIHVLSALVEVCPEFEVQGVPVRRSFVSTVQETKTDLTWFSSIANHPGALSKLSTEAIARIFELAQREDQSQEQRSVILKHLMVAASKQLGEYVFTAYSGSSGLVSCFSQKIAPFADQLGEKEKFDFYKGLFSGYADLVPVGKQLSEIVELETQLECYLGQEGYSWSKNLVQGYISCFNSKPAAIELLLGNDESFERRVALFSLSGLKYPQFKKDMQAINAEEQSKICEYMYLRWKDPQYGVANNVFFQHAFKYFAAQKLTGWVTALNSMLEEHPNNFFAFVESCYKAHNSDKKLLDHFIYSNVKEIHKARQPTLSTDKATDFFRKVLNHTNLSFDPLQQMSTIQKEFLAAAFNHNSLKFFIKDLFSNLMKNGSYPQQIVRTLAEVDADYFPKELSGQFFANALEALMNPQHAEILLSFLQTANGEGFGAIAKGSYTSDNICKALLSNENLNVLCQRIKEKTTSGDVNDPQAVLYANLLINLFVLISCEKNPNVEMLETISAMTNILGKEAIAFAHILHPGIVNTFYAKTLFGIEDKNNLEHLAQIYTEMESELSSKKGSMTYLRKSFYDKWVSGLSIKADQDNINQKIWEDLADKASQIEILSILTDKIKCFAITNFIASNICSMFGDNESFKGVISNIYSRAGISPDKEIAIYTERFISLKAGHAPIKEINDVEAAISARQDVSWNPFQRYQDMLELMRKVLSKDELERIADWDTMLAETLPNLLKAKQDELYQSLYSAMNGGCDALETDLPALLENIGAISTKPGKFASYSVLNKQDPNRVMTLFNFISRMNHELKERLGDEYNQKLNQRIENVESLIVIALQKMKEKQVQPAAA